MKKNIYRFLLLLLIAFFSYTFINKILDIEGFMLNIAKTSLFRGYMVDIIACSALIAEGLSIILLLFKEKMGLIISWLMMFCFTCYICILYFLSLYEVCGLPFQWHLLINCIVIVVISYLLYEKL